MASLAEMERELTVERLPAGLEVGRKRQMTDSKSSRQKTTGQRYPASAQGQVPRCVDLCALPLDSSFYTSLAYDFYHFQKRPQLKS